LPFETTAIMAASGSGKTSLLFNAMSRRTGNHNNNTGTLVVLEGDIRFGDHSLKISSTRKIIQDHITYVTQFDTLHEASTPLEAIYFSAKLRLPKDTSEDDIRSLVNHTLHALINHRLKHSLHLTRSYCYKKDVPIIQAKRNLSSMISLGWVTLSRNIPILWNR